MSSGFVRHSTLVHLSGAGHMGVGEDVTYDAGDQLAFQRAGAVHGLDGTTTLAELSTRLGALDLFPAPPARDADRDYRRWAFESAALDLALRQAGRSLADALGRRPRPVRFVVSPGLGRPPTSAPVRLLLEMHAGLRFKLDATREWDEALIDELAALDAVDVIDLKGAYRGTPVDQEADAGLYGRVARAFPRAWIEDPRLTPATAAILADHMERVTWDAPIRSLADVEALAFEPRGLNVKPSRFGSLARLCAFYDHCAARGIAMYGGGQFELGPGRGQVQYLASLFHPDAPNDVAPAAYNAPLSGPPPPPSPLAPAPASTGFAWNP